MESDSVLKSKKVDCRTNICMLCNFAFVVTEINSSGERIERKLFHEKCKLTEERLGVIRKVLPNFTSNFGDNGVCKKCYRRLERILYLGDVLNRLEDNIETNLKNVSSLDLPSDKTEKFQVTKRPSTQWSRSQTAPTQIEKQRKTIPSVEGRHSLKIQPDTVINAHTSHTPGVIPVCVFPVNYSCPTKQPELSKLPMSGTTPLIPLLPKQTKPMTKIIFGDDINNGICLKCNKVVERIIHMEGEIAKLKNGLKESCKVALAKAREMLAEKKLKSPCSTVTLKQPKASKIIVKPATRPASNYVQQFVAIAPKPADIPKPDSARPVIIPWFGKNDTWKGERIICDDKIEECNRTILPVQSENTQQPAESTVLPSSSNSNFQMFIVDNSGSSDVNNSCIVSQNSATLAYQNSPELASNVKQEPVDAYTEFQDSTQNSVENNDSQTNAFPPIVYGNVNSNNHNRTNMEEVTSSSILNKTHVNQEKPTFDSTPMMVLAPSNNVQQIILSGNMGVNSSQNLEGNSCQNKGGNSSSHLFSNQVSVPSLQTTNTTRTVELNKNQGLEPQLDSTECRSKCFDILKDALQNTMSKLGDLGGEVAAWVVIPNEDNSSLIHHMGSKKGREFIKCKPDIDADLCDFLKTKKESRRKANRRKTTKIRCRLDEESYTLENMETVHATSDVEPLENIAKNNVIPCISLNDCKPTDVVFSVKGSDDDSSCLVVRQTENSSKEEELQVKAPRRASPRQNAKQKLKRKISSVYMDQLSDDESLSEPLEETKASLVERFKKLFSHKYALATFKEKAEFPYKLLKLRGKPWFILSGFPEDLLPFRHPSEYDIDSLKRIMENQDKIKFHILHRKLSEAYYNKEACENKTKLALQKRISQDSIQPTKSSTVADEDMETFIKTIELEVSKSFESQKDEQESNSALKDEKFTKILTSPLQSSENKNMAENTLLLDSHSSTAEKSNLEISGDNSFTQIKEEPVDYEVIATQEVKHRKIVPENTVHLDTHSSTTEKSTVRLKEDSFSNDIKEEPIDYEFQ